MKPRSKDNQNNVYNSEQVIRLFVQKHWTEQEIHEQTNLTGRWLQVPSPDRPNDKRRCLGFNLNTGSVNDWYGGFGGEFVEYVIHYMSLRSRSEAERFLANLVIEAGLSPEEVVHLTQQERPQPVPPSSDDVLLPEITLPPHTYPIDLDEPVNPGVMARAQAYLRDNRGLTAQEVRDAELGLCLNPGSKMLERIVIPVRDEWGRLVWYQGRDITGWASRKDNKYYNPFEVDRSRLVYNLNGIEPGKPVVLCEGFFDAIVCKGVVCFGKYLNEYQLQRILSRQPSEIILGFDADLPGVDAIFNLIREYVDLNFRVVILPLHIKDLGDLTRDRAAVEAAIRDAQPWNTLTKAVVLARAMRGLE